MHIYIYIYMYTRTNSPPMQPLGCVALVSEWANILTHMRPIYHAHILSKTYYCLELYDIHMIWYQFYSIHLYMIWYSCVPYTMLIYFFINHAITYLLCLSYRYHGVLLNYINWHDISLYNLLHCAIVTLHYLLVWLLRCIIWLCYCVMLHLVLLTHILLLLVLLFLLSLLLLLLSTCIIIIIIIIIISMFVLLIIITNLHYISMVVVLA